MILKRFFNGVHNKRFYKATIVIMPHDLKVKKTDQFRMLPVSFGNAAPFIRSCSQTEPPSCETPSVGDFTFFLLEGNSLFNPPSSVQEPSTQHNTLFS